MFGGEIPQDIQEVLTLDVLKARVDKSLRKNPDAQSFFKTLTPSEIFELMPEGKNYNHSNRGYLFERIAEVEIDKEESTSIKVIQLKTVLRQLMMKEPFRKYVGYFGDPDFLTISNDFEIQKIYECKLSTGSIHQNKNQSVRGINTYHKLIELLVDQNAPEELKTYIEQINQISKHQLRLSQNLNYSYVFPKDLENKERTKTYVERGVGVRYSKLTNIDVTNIYNQMTEALSNHQSK